MENKEYLKFKNLYNHCTNEFEDICFEVEDPKGDIQYVKLCKPGYVDTDEFTLATEYIEEMSELIIITLLKLHNDTIKKLAEKAREEDKADILRFIIKGEEDFEKFSDSGFHDDSR